MNNLIVKRIALWLSETALACFLEVFLWVFINVWNTVIREYALSFRLMDIDYLYGVSNYADASTIYDHKDITDDMVSDDLIGLGNSEDQSLIDIKTNTLHTNITGNCEGICNAYNAADKSDHTNKYLDELHDVFSSIDLKSNNVKSDENVLVKGDCKNIAFVYDNIENDQVTVPVDSLMYSDSCMNLFTQFNDEETCFDSNDDTISEINDINREKIQKCKVKDSIGNILDTNAVFEPYEMTTETQQELKTNNIHFYDETGEKSSARKEASEKIKYDRNELNNNLEHNFDFKNDRTSDNKKILTSVIETRHASAEQYKEYELSTRNTKNNFKPKTLESLSSLQSKSDQITSTHDVLEASMTVDIEEDCCITFEQNECGLSLSNFEVEKSLQIDTYNEQILTNFPDVRKRQCSGLLQTACQQTLTEKELEEIFGAFQPDLETDAIFKWQNGLNEEKFPNQASKKDYKTNEILESSSIGSAIHLKTEVNEIVIEEKKVNFSTEVNTFTYEPNLSIMENFQLEDSFSMDRINDSERDFSSEEDVISESVCLFDDLDENWRHYGQHCHLKCRTCRPEQLSFPRTETRNIIEAPRKGLKNWAIIKDPFKQFTRKKNEDSFQYSDSGSRNKKSTWSLSNLKIDPICFVNKLKKKVTKKQP